MNCSNQSNVAFSILFVVAVVIVIISFFVLSYHSSCYHIILLVPLGSIPELPATSCQEINKNEGKKLDSGKYWMSLSGTIVHVYCNMSTVPEGKFNPCISIIII